MYDVKEIQRLYEKYGSMRQVAREIRMSRNTVSKHLKRVEEFRSGKKSKIIYKESANHRRISQATIERNMGVKEIIPDGIMGIPCGHCLSQFTRPKR